MGVTDISYLIVTFARLTNKVASLSEKYLGKEWAMSICMVIFCVSANIFHIIWQFLMLRLVIVDTF